MRRLNARTRRQMLGVLIALAGVLLAGTVGYAVIEGWTVWKSLFFTVITITTVGYGDYGLSPAGERFTLLVMAGGIGVVTYSITQIFPLFFDQSRMQERRMYKRIMQLKDHHVVCGLGRIGRTVCAQLAASETPFVAVDPSEEAVRWALAEGFLAVVGDATEDDVLDEVNVQNARGLTCVAKEDSANIVIALSAHHLNPDLFIIARAEHEDAARKLEHAGASLVISPTKASGDSIAQALQHPELAILQKPITGTTPEFEIVEVTIDPGGGLDGLTVGDIAARFPGTSLVALRDLRAAARVRPEDDTVLETGMIAVIAGRRADLNKLFDDGASRRTAA